MSANIGTHYAQQFASTIQLLLQQKGSRLRNAVMVGNHVGSQASPVDQFGAVEALQVASRYGAMQRVDASTDRRWVFPTDYELPQLLDSFDELRLITDPKSKYVENAVNALGRKMDAAILAAALGTAKTGVAGGTSTTLGSGQQIAVNYGSASDVGLTVSKLRRAKKILMAADVDVDSDPLYVAIGAEQHDDLLAEVQVTNADYNGGQPVLKDGKIMSFMGFNFIHTELAVATAMQSSGDAYIMAWAKSGMHLGIWNDIKTSISQRHDLSSEPWQAYVYATFGATRLEEEKVVRIQCNLA